jgi:general secretion pathway protein C
VSPRLRIGVRAGNLALLAVCCFVAADITNQLSADALRPRPPAWHPVAAGVAVPEPDWADRKPILDRNLFGAQRAELAAAPMPPQEKIEKTGLAIELLGTLASSDRDTRMASILYTDHRDYEVLRPGEPLSRLPNVQLARVERGRIILRNGGNLEVLSLEDRARSRPEVRASQVRSRRLQERLKRRSRIRSVYDRQRR